MRPPNVEGGHLTAQSDSRPNVDALAKVPDTSIVPSGANARDAKRSRRRGLPLANASLYAPAAGRTLWALSIRCPYGCGIHLDRVREEGLAGGPRRTGCGRRVWVCVRAVYRGTAEIGGAA